MTELTKRGQISRLYYEALIQAILNAPIPQGIYIRRDNNKYYGEEARDHLDYLFANHVIPAALKKAWEQTYMVQLFNTLLSDADMLYAKYDDFDELLHRLNHEQADYLIQALTRLREDNDLYYDFRERVREQPKINENYQINKFNNKYKESNNERMEAGGTTAAKKHAGRYDRQKTIC